MLAVWRSSLGGLAWSRSKVRSTAVLDEATDCSPSDLRAVYCSSQNWPSALGLPSRTSSMEMPSDLILSSSPSTEQALAGGDGGGCGGGGLGGRNAGGVGVKYAGVGVLVASGEHE